MICTCKTRLAASARWTKRIPPIYLNINRIGHYATTITPHGTKQLKPWTACFAFPQIHSKTYRKYTDLTFYGKTYNLLWQRKPTQRSKDSLWYDMSCDNWRFIKCALENCFQKALRHFNFCCHEH